LRDDFDELLVLAAHPDDESLGVGGLVALAGRHGLPVRVVVATDGEASHPEATAWTPELLGRVRRSEVEAAVERLVAGAVVEHLGMPDGGLDALEEVLADAVAGRTGPRTLLLAPWLDDGHPDHDAAGRAALEAGRRSGAAVAHYPLWLWHWGTPDDLNWSRVHVVELDRAALDAREAALAAHRSQTTPIGPGAGDEPVVTGPVLRRARRLVEVVLAEPGVLPIRPSTTEDDTAGTFDAMYDGDEDPWRMVGSFYEERKRALAVAALGRRRYRSALEIGCATGILTRDLAARADHVTALDVSAEALEVARRDGPPAVTWVLGGVPADVPVGRFDLVVLSEVGYFLTPLHLLETLRLVRARLAPGGEVVLVHWRHPTDGIPLDGPAVHDQARSALGDLPLRSRYEDADLLLDVLGGPVSLAAEEGRR
ncbi:MAG: PIG-L family deacetylase, partial [Micrococcales bacterium]|nr:PIG-L family deacetylase [Micrococcales bacterium]